MKSINMCDKHILFCRWTVSRCGRSLCLRTDWPSPCWTNRRSAVREGISSKRFPAGRSVTPSVTSHRSCLSTRKWVFRLQNPHWFYLSTPQAQLYWLSLPSAATSRGFTSCTGRRTRLTNASTPLCSPTMVMHFIWLHWFSEIVNCFEEMRCFVKNV